MADKSVEATCLPCKDAATRDWYAWNDFQPPRPDYFHIVGEVCVPNPGVDPMLVFAEPQGPNPSISILDLYLCQRPGIWPQVRVWKPVRYDRKIMRGYTEAHIRCGTDIIAKVPVEDVR